MKHYGLNYVCSRTAVRGGGVLTLKSTDMAQALPDEINGYVTMTMAMTEASLKCARHRLNFISTCPKDAMGKCIHLRFSAQTYVENWSSAQLWNDTNTNKVMGLMIMAIYVTHNQKKLSLVAMNIDFRYH